MANAGQGREQLDHPVLSRRGHRGSRQPVWPWQLTRSGAWRKQNDSLGQRCPPVWLSAGYRRRWSAWGSHCGVEDGYPDIRCRGRACSRQRDRL